MKACYYGVFTLHMFPASATVSGGISSTSVQRKPREASCKLQLRQMLPVS